MTPIYMKTIVDSITGPGASATARARRAWPSGRRHVQDSREKQVSNSERALQR
jgi:hypothetical protein